MLLLRDDGRFSKHRENESMKPTNQFAGAAGVASAVLLVCETSAFLFSGWSPQRFTDPVQALALLEQGGTALRAAAAFGFVGLAATTFLIVGLAAALHERAPNLATGTLYFGLIGIAGHSLVPLGLWSGIPAFLTMAGQRADTAQHAWFAFAQVSDAAHGIGNLFGGLAMLAAGAAAMVRPRWSIVVGLLGLSAGALTLATLLTVGTAFVTIGGALFMPALALTVLFRLASGLVLLTRSNRVRQSFGTAVGS
jgi:hypothetical protein